MKIKNFKSAIHNFADSFQSINYMKSQVIVINVLIDLKNNNLEVPVIFDFINKTIEPKEAISETSLKLLEDYLDWLPRHLKNHNCDIDYLEKLEVKIYLDFSKVINRTKNMVNFLLETEVVYKIKGKDEKIIKIDEEKSISRKFLDIGFPDLFRE